MGRLIKVASWIGARILVARAILASRGKSTGRSKEFQLSRRGATGATNKASSRQPHSADRSGDQAEVTPLELEASEWKATIKRTVREIKEDRVPFAAAGMAYYFFLAIFPALIALVGILGVAEIDASGLIQSIRDTLPGGAGEALTQAVARANRPSEAASLTAAVLGIAAALWSASSGMVALQSGLNVAYDISEDRKMVGKRGMALVLLFVTILLGGVPSPFFTFGEATVFKVLGWVLTVAAVIGMFSLFYYLGPNRERPAWRWVSIGGIVGAALWIVGSLVFGLYVTTFNNYGKTYGPLGGVIVLVFWLYLSSLSVLIGGELNAELEREASAK
jgi:membrane protein